MSIKTGFELYLKNNSDKTYMLLNSSVFQSTVQVVVKVFSKRNSLRLTNARVEARVINTRVQFIRAERSSLHGRVAGQLRTCPGRRVLDQGLELVLDSRPRFTLLQ